MLVSGVGLPVALVHSGVIPGVAGWMSGVGGAVGYATSEYRPSVEERETLLMRLGDSLDVLAFLCVQD